MRSALAYVAPGSSLYNEHLRRLKAVEETGTGAVMYCMSATVTSVNGDNVTVAYTVRGTQQGGDIYCTDSGSTTFAFNADNKLERRW